MTTLTKSPDQLQQEEIQRQALEAAARRIELERADAARAALEDAARRVEQLDGNPIYQKAWKAASIAIRSMLAKA